jgi:AcrR family transcriptional regulator
MAKRRAEKKKRAVGQHHGDLRAALLQAGVQALEGGVDPGIRELTRRVGVTAAAAYHHFASQDHLLAALAEQAFAGLHTTLLATMTTTTTTTAQQRLQAMVGAYVRFALSHRAHYRVMFRSMKLAEVTPTVQAAALSTFGELASAIAAARTEVGLDDCDPTTTLARVRQAAAAAWALTHGHVVLAIDDVWSGLGDHRDVEALAADVGALVAVVALQR